MARLKAVDSVTLKRWLDQGEAILVDVREPEEYATGHIAGAQLMPLANFDPTLLAQTADQKLVFQCQNGSKSQRVALHLTAIDRPVIYVLVGGIQLWQDAKYPIERYV